jgi:uncharacterized protein YciI
MWYAIISEDSEESVEKRLAARPDHLSRINKLVDEGRLLVAGPHPAVDSQEPDVAGYTGSLIIAEFESLDDARTWADADPYVAAGVYGKVTVKPFNRALP